MAIYSANLPLSILVPLNCLCEFRLSFGHELQEAFTSEHGPLAGAGGIPVMIRLSL